MNVPRESRLSVVSLSNVAPPYACRDEEAQIDALKILGFSEATDEGREPYPKFTRTASGWPVVILRPTLTFWAKVTAGEPGYGR